MGEREDYLHNDDMDRWQKQGNTGSRRGSNIGGGKGGGGCVVALLVLAGSLISASYGVYQIFC